MPNCFLGTKKSAPVGHLCGRRTVMYVFLCFFELKASNSSKLCGQHIMDDRIDSAIKKQIMPGSRFWNKNLAEQKEMIKRIKSLKKEELYRLLHERKSAIWPINPDSQSKPSSLLPNDWIDMPDHMHFGRFYFSIPIYFFNDEFDCGKVNLMAKLEFDNGPEHSVRSKAFIFAHQFIRSFNRFSVEDFRFSMNIDSTVKKFVLNEKDLKIMILDDSKTFVRGFNYSPNLRIIGYECPNSLWCWMYLFREYGEENAICVETYIKQSSLSQTSSNHDDWPNHGKDREVEKEKNESIFMANEDSKAVHLFAESPPIGGAFPLELECSQLIEDVVGEANKAADDQFLRKKSKSKSKKHHAESHYGETDKRPRKRGRKELN